MDNFFVVIFKWARGIFLLHSKHEFDNAKDALDFAQQNDTPDEIKTIKVFNPQGEVVESTNVNTDTYA